MTDFDGVHALVPTPLTKGTEIDIDSLRTVIDFEIENGCKGIGVLAAIGEGYLVSDKDWRKVVETAVDHMNGRGYVNVGCASMGTRQAVELARAAEDMGADSVLAFNPQGMRGYNIDELHMHFKAITDAVDIEVVPYARGGDLIPFEVLERLVEEERIRYMKYAYRSCSLLKRISETLGDRLYLFCGADSWTLRYLLLGCRGIFHATAAVFPQENVELLDHVKNGRTWEARKLWYERVLTWNDSGFYENWQWAHKYALMLMGVIETDTMYPPQGRGEDYHRAEIEALLRYQGKL